MCIGGVLVAEMLNTSLEYLAQAITDQPDPRIGKALDVASGSVLLASLFAAIVGLIVLVPPILDLFWAP